MSQWIVELARTRLSGAKVSSDGLLHCKVKHCPDVRVSPASLDRALKVLGSTLSLLEGLGHPVRLIQGDPDLTVVTMLGEPLHLAVEEETVRVEKPLTPRQQADLKKYGQVWGREYAYHPTGQLSLRIRNLGGTGIRQTWGDSPKKPLEDRVREVVRGLIQTVDRLRGLRARQEAERLRREEEHRRREEARRAWAEKQERVRLEKERVAQLFKDAKDWNASQALRRYLEAVQAAALERDGAIPPDSDLAEWLGWAARQADRMDPLVPSPHSILDDKPEEEPYRWPWSTS